VGGKDSGQPEVAPHPQENSKHHHKEEVTPGNYSSQFLDYKSTDKVQLPVIGVRNSGALTKNDTSSYKNKNSKIDEEREEDSAYNSARGDQFPLRKKNTCCSEVLLVSLSDLVPLLEQKIGFKCDEAFLEDSALRLIKQSFKKNDCDCLTYQYIMVDLDDPTIILQRFVTNVAQVLSDHKVQIPIIACSIKDTEKNKLMCKKLEVQFLKKPVTVDSVKHLVK
jgi:hypothetical protein